MEKSNNKRSVNTSLKIAFIPLAVGINLGIGAIVQVLKLPVFLDSVGTIITALLLGWKAGATVGVLGFAVSSITIFPPAIYFSLTQVCIAIYVFLAGNVGGFRSFSRTIFSGLGLAVLAAIVSAPVIYYLFGGITGNGISVLTLFLEAKGLSKASAVIISGIIAEFLDKVTQCLIAVYILQRIPKTLIQQFKNKSLVSNNFIRE